MWFYFTQRINSTAVHVYVKFFQCKKLIYQYPKKLDDIKTFHYFEYNGKTIENIERS